MGGVVSIVVVKNISGNVIITHPGIATNVQDIELMRRSNAHDYMHGSGNLYVLGGDVVTAAPISSRDHVFIGTLNSFEAKVLEVSP